MVLPMLSIAMLLEVCLIKACALTPLMPKELALAMGPSPDDEALNIPVAFCNGTKACMPCL